MKERELKCSVCGNSNSNREYILQEKMYGSGDEFNYFQCSKCGCLQIEKIPENIAEYYPTDYMAFSINEKLNFKKKISSWLLIHSYRNQINQRDLVGKLAKKYNDYYQRAILWAKDSNFNSKVLDVGCGVGKRLLLMHKIGYKNLEGIDPFIQNDIVYYDKIHIKKGDIYDLNGKYDFITLHHSFEHMPNPRNVFEKISGLLSDEGILLIRVPVMDCFAWKEYGVNWFQLDAPRHFFSHTINSIEFLAKLNNMVLTDVVFDSTESQFVYSEKYKNNIPLDGKSIHSKEEIKNFHNKALELNESKEGDMACFFIKKNKLPNLIGDM